VILLFDGDEAGNIAAGRGVEVLLSNDLDVTVVTLAEGEDPFEYFSRHTAEDFQALVEQRGEDFFDFSVRFHGSRLDLSSAGGKARLARVLLKLVDCHQDLIKKSLLIKKIAGTLGIDEDVLRKEYGKAFAPKSRPGRAPEEPPPPVRRGVTITSSEDDLILGLLRRPSLVEKFREELGRFDSEDAEAVMILKAILDLDAADAMNIRELTAVLQPEPQAMKRVIALASDPRQTDPELLVTSALAALKKSKIRKEYEIIRNQSRAMLQQKDPAETDRILKELNRRLKLKSESDASEKHE
jgi:DNA primase